MLKERAEYIYGAPHLHTESELKLAIMILEYFDIEHEIENDELVSANTRIEELEYENEELAQEIDNLNDRMLDMAAEISQLEDKIEDLKSDLQEKD